MSNDLLTKEEKITRENYKYLVEANNLLLDDIIFGINTLHNIPNTFHERLDTTYDIYKDKGCSLFELCKTPIFSITLQELLDPKLSTLGIIPALEHISKTLNQHKIKISYVTRDNDCMFIIS